MLAYVCLSIVCSASLFIAFGTVVPHGWQGYRLYRFREQSVFLRVLYYNVPEVRCRKKVQKKSLYNLDVIIKAYTFAPAFERERRFRNDGNVEVSLGRG